MGEEQEHIEFLVSRRSKRSTAGNRMQAALAEMAVADDAKEEDDNDFVIENDEQDVFESDFASTDEEDAAQDVGEVEEGRVQEEERRARRSARSKLDKATAAAHARNKATFNPQISADSASSQKPRPKASASTEDVPDDEAPEASGSATQVEATSSPLKRKRMSLRAQTVRNTSATVKRLKESEHHKALAPKKSKIEAKHYTQAQLIARALDNEEGNITEHRDYLKVEEEKRRQARVVRATVKGPALRWITRAEMEKKKTPPPPSPPPPRLPPALPNLPPASHPVPSYSSYPLSAGSFPVTTTYTRPLHHHPYTTQVQPYNSSFIAFQSWPPQQQHQPPPTFSSPYTPYAINPLSAPSSTFTTQQAPVPAPPPLISAPPQALLPQTPTPLSPPPAAAPPIMPGSNLDPDPDPEPELPVLGPDPAPNPDPKLTPVPEMEKVGKHYLVHMLSQHSGAKKPSWNDTMQVMFGKDVKWDQVKIYSGKNRPPSRHIDKCPMSGNPAKYLDPVTGVPFADVDSFRVLRGLVDHSEVWSPLLGSYVG